MATTRIIPMHVNQGKTIADCLTDRIDYSKNPDKTQGGSSGIFTITLSGTPPRWTASESSAIFSAPAGPSQGSATPSAPSIGSP